MRLAVDAANLVRDRRGLGRIVRGVLRCAAREPNVRLTLLADKPDDVRALGVEFAGLPVRASATARRADRYDVVWFPFNGMRYTVVPPAVVTIYDAFAFTEPARGAIARYREQAPIRRAARRAALVLTISAWSRAEIVRELGVSEATIEVVSPAPDPFFTPALGDPLPAALVGRRFALLVGAGEPRKNARLALEACARALRAPDELLLIVGALEAAEREFALRRGVPAGEVAASDATLRALYRNAAVVLVPSLAEGFGLTAVEAMACGAPVLAADAAALPEATGGAATLLDPRDPAAWAAAIRTLFDDENRAAAARARGAVRVALLDRAGPSRRVLRLLDDVASGGRRGAP